MSKRFRELMESLPSEHQEKIERMAEELRLEFRSQKENSSSKAKEKQQTKWDKK